MDDLPVDMLREILALLSWEDAAHMTALSHTWHALWAEFRVYEDFDFVQGPNQTFTDFINDVDQRLLELRAEKGIIQKFRLCIMRDRNFEMGSHMDDWIKLVLENCIRYVDLRIYPDGVWYCLPPQSLFAAKPLQVLRLQGCKLENPLFADTRNLCNLRELSLVNVVLDDEVLHDLMIGCPLLVDLDLTECRGFKILVIPASLRKLERFMVGGGTKIKRISIDARNLRYFQYYSGWEKLPRTSVPRYLTTLNIDTTEITDFSFKYIVSRLPLLRNLKLTDCFGMKAVRISHSSLRTLSLVLETSLSILEVKIPSLVSFEYGSDRVPHHFSINAPSLQESILRIEIKFPIWIDNSWFHNLRVYLSKLNQYPTLVIKFHMDMPIEEATFVPGEFSDHIVEMLPPVCVIQRLEMRTVTHPSHLERFLDGLLWCCHPAEIVAHGNTRFIRFLWKRLLVDRVKDPLCPNDKRIRCWRDPLCCTDSRIRCWRHYVRNVSIKGLTTAKEKSKYLSSLPYRGRNPPQNACFQLKWYI